MSPQPAATRHALKYRPEIDGLRALAILPVVFFHYRIPFFRGGFVGVDVFFVISGFLITSLIAAEMDSGEFSIARFYERRIRRIFPALFFLLAAASIAAYVVLFPDDLVRYAQSLAATAGFASNFEFWREAGYFDVASDQKPLLHLWSIAVEEQFYLLFPAFLISLRWLSLKSTSPAVASKRSHAESRSRRENIARSAEIKLHDGNSGTVKEPGVSPFHHLAGSHFVARLRALGLSAAPRLCVNNFYALGIFAVLLLSFAFSVWGVQNAKEAAFYLLPSRAWELMLGAILAVGAVPQVRDRALREAGALAGLVLIGVAVFKFNPDLPFPGPLALLPCLGTALVIHCTTGEGTGTGKILSLRPLVFVGLISYSLYLWHWPLLVFAKYILFRDLGTAERAVLIALSFVAAILSWRFVERPFRRPVARAWLFPGAVTTMAAALAVGIVALVTDGLPQRLPVNLQRILAEQDDAEARIDSCFPMTAPDVEAGGLCTIGATGAKPSFLLWGDSHADALVPPVQAVARRAERAGLLAGGASCAPLLGVTMPRADCRPFNDAVAKAALSPAISDVILEARWAKYADGATYGDEPRGHIVITDDASAGPPAPDNHAVFARGLERTIAVLVRAGKRVTIVASVPEVGWPVPAVLARRALAHEKGRADVSFDRYMQRQNFVMAEFARVHARFGVTVLYPHEALCTKESCAVSLNGIPLYRDEHHLSVYGALKLEPLMTGML